MCSEHGATSASCSRVPSGLLSAGSQKSERGYPENEGYIATRRGKLGVDFLLSHGSSVADKRVLKSTVG